MLKLLTKSHSLIIIPVAIENAKLKRPSYIKTAKEN